MGRRVGVVGADHALELRKYRCGLCLIGGHQCECAHAFAVERERLGEGAGNQERQTRFSKQAYRKRIIFQVFAKTLIGDIQERHVLTARDYIDHLGPVGQSQVYPGRVVAAGMQYNDGTFR